MWGAEDESESALITDTNERATKAKARSENADITGAREILTAGNGGFRRPRRGNNVRSPERRSVEAGWNGGGGLAGGSSSAASSRAENDPEAAARHWVE